MRSQTPIKHFEGLYGDLNFRKRNEYVFLESIKTRSSKFNWIIDNHIHSNLYQLFYIEEGAVEFFGPHGREALSIPCVLIIPPNVVHGFKFSPNIKGKILTLSDIVVESICKSSPAVLVSFGTFQYLWYSEDNKMIFIKLVNTLVDIEEELFSDKPEKNAYLRAFFLQHFIYLLRQLESNNNSGYADNYKALKFFHKFQVALKKSEHSKNIPAYSDELGITPTHLNRICKQIVGKTTLLLIQENKIEKAKNYLIHTNYSVSEIAYKAGFEYPNYFAKLFRKITGLQPSEYRKTKKKSLLEL
ncbi:AraC family transcriptional activator of pobA [Chryseobacterium rhizosphaerae]|nr:AraC family transcriptional activator of pobA [Chryseobacterium rhizosphaerae]